jgi:hypothetical protein
MQTWIPSRGFGAEIPFKGRGYPRTPREAQRDWACHLGTDTLCWARDAGLTLELLHEQPYTNAPWPWLERGTDGYYRLPAGWPRFPLTYSLRARRPA